MPYTFLLEKSRTPIYQRIIEGFQAALVQLGHAVMLVDANSFESDEKYLSYIQKQSIDYCLIPNPMGFLAQYLESRAAFLFELIDVPLIFVHHDHCLSHLYHFERIQRQIQAFQNVKHRSCHFCLEYHNFLDLSSLGLRAYSLPHASEFARQEMPADSPAGNPAGNPVDSLAGSPADSEAAYEVSFVGHVLPSLGDELTELPHSHRLRSDFWQRLVHFDYQAETSARQFATEFSPDQTEAGLFAAKSFYLSLLHSHSQHFRGEVIRRIHTGNVAIVGGDPAYLHGFDSNRKLIKDNVKYYPPTVNYSETQNIYRHSKINLNITSLQFDQAVINRVIDIGAAGGFVLTDRKLDLEKLTSVAHEISYRSIEELNAKIAYYLHPDHQQERQEIAHVLHHDIQKHCTYPTVVEFMLSKLDASSPENPKPLRIDLGCGPWKAEGFIGVDIAPGVGVDVVADLTQRFPFATSSVDVVRAYDVVEHLVDRIHTMNEIWRVCKPNGIVDIRVPSTDGRGAFQDPTHVSFWNIHSFRYYCVEFPNYLQLCHSYGFQGAFRILSLSEAASEEQVIHVRAVLAAIKPGAPDWVAQFKLRPVNWLVCPNWDAAEDQLFSALLDLLRGLLVRSDKTQITLLLEAGTADPEAIDAAITGVLMELMAEGIDLDETIEISILADFDPQQWQTLLPYVSARILFPLENPAVSAAIASLPVIPFAELAAQED